LSLGAIQGKLSPDECMLVYLVDGEQTWLWLVRPQVARLFRLDIGSQEITSNVQYLRAFLDPASNPNLQPFPATIAYNLYEKMLEPAARYLEGVRRLIVVPDGDLGALPLSVLVTEKPANNPTSFVQHRSIAWLARSYAISNVPSVGSLYILRELPPPPEAQYPFLGVGNPTAKEEGPAVEKQDEQGDALRGAPSERISQQLRPLPETETELRAIAKLLGAKDESVLLGAQASNANLEKMPLSNYRVLAFATHSVMLEQPEGSTDPRQIALVLSPSLDGATGDDGLLTPAKIATLKLGAEFVVLSACNTADEQVGVNRSALAGLDEPFFYAGARSILVSNWPVWSSAAVEITTKTFDELRASPLEGRAKALQKSMLSMLSDSSPQEFAHPAAWAAFTLDGEGGIK
jgi:CHAT domain-containing protein